MMQKAIVNNTKSLSLISLSIPFLFMAIASFVVPIINTLILTAVPNYGVIFAESVGVASQINNVFTILITFVSSGIGVIIGQMIGKNSLKLEMEKAIYSCILISFIFSIIVVAISETLSPFILYGFLIAGTEQYNNALTYIQIIALVIIISTVRNTIGSILNNYGYIKYTIAWNIASILLDITFTFIFVMPLNLGVLGSALGTIFAVFITLCFSILIFQWKIMKINIRKFKIDKYVIKQLLKISVPIGAEKISYNIAMFIVGLLIAQIGMKFPNSFIVVEGNSNVNLLNLSNTMISTFSGSITLVSIAFSQGAAIICARAMGAGDYDYAKKILFKSFLISIIFDMTLATILFFLQNQIVDFFTITNKVVITYKPVIKKIIFVPFILLILLQYGRTCNIIYLVGPMTYGNLVMNSIFSTTSTWGLILILGLTSLFASSDNNKTFLYGINGIYLLMALDELFRGIFNVMWWRSKRWMTNKIFYRKNKYKIRRK